MALAMQVDSVDELDESIKALYVETDDGKFRLDLDGYEDPKGLKSALDKERDSNKKLNKMFKDFQTKYEGIDPEKVRSLLSKIKSDEEAKLLADGKIDEVVHMRIDKQRKELERLVKEAEAKAEASEKRAKTREQKVLDNNIRSAAMSAGLHPNAIEDALFRGRTMFSLNDKDEAVQLDEDGHVVPGKDGSTPFSPTEWLEEMKEKAPHWFPAVNSGGGASGNGSRRSNQDLSKLSPRERLLAARKQT